MAEEVAAVSYEDLAAIEDDFEEIDTQIMRQQYELSKSAYAKRAEAASKIPHFWALVLEEAPIDIDQYIQPQDSQVIGDHLVAITVSRPELDQVGAAGNPRSLSIKFEFSPNEYFSDTTLEKSFWYRRASDGWTGMVSEPVRIHWKKGKDLTEGLTDAAASLWEARKKVGDMSAKGLPEYKELEKKVEHWNGANTSFFTWFGWVSGRRWVSAEESDAANKKYAARKQARNLGEKASVAVPGEDHEEDEEEQEDDQAVEVHQDGEGLAISFAEDLWPNAIKYFTQAQEQDQMSEAGFEDMDDDEEDAEEGDDEPIDIRSLVQDKGKGRPRESGGGSVPPKKKARR